MTTETETLVIGAGVIGLAVAERLSRSGREVVLIEKEPRFGSHTSSRNSEVIHAGIYYPQDSLKARLCVRGRELIYDFCQSHNVPHKQTGKYIIASSNDQINKLSRIKTQAERNGVALSWVSGEAVMARYPLLRCQRALFSPSSGILDAHQFMLALLGRLEHQNGALAVNTQATRIYQHQDYFHVELRMAESAHMTLRTQKIINCAGLDSWALAERTATTALPRTIPPRHLAKGHYFRPKKNLSFDHLIYPLPEPSSLGVHVTRDLGGQIKFGPDVQWVNSINYDMPTLAPEPFISAIEHYLPDIRDIGLVPDYCGIRPKCAPTDNDFIFHELKPKPNMIMINCFGIESPGLTASLAIADYIENMMQNT